MIIKVLRCTHQTKLNRVILLKVCQSLRLANLSFLCGVQIKMKYLTILFNKFLLKILFCLTFIHLTACHSNNHYQTEEKATASTTSDSTQKLTIYTTIDGKDIQYLLLDYAKQSGITLDVISDQPMSLLARLKAEGENATADVLLTEDVNILQQAMEESLLQAFNPTKIKKLSEKFYDPQGYWLALSYYGRTIVYDSRMIADGEIQQFSDLNKEKYKQKLCLTKGSYAPNQALTYYLMQNLGDKKTEEILTGWQANAISPILVDDSSVLSYIQQGKCQVGVVNSHVYGKFLQKNPQTPIKLQWAQQMQGGIPINMVAVAIAHSAKQPEQALALVEWLGQQKQQTQFASLSHTWTLDSTISPNLPTSPITMREYAEKRKQTMAFMQDIHYD